MIHFVRDSQYPAHVFLLQTGHLGAIVHTNAMSPNTTATNRKPVSTLLTLSPMTHLVSVPGNLAMVLGGRTTEGLPSLLTVTSHDPV